MFSSRGDRWPPVVVVGQELRADHTGALLAHRGYLPVMVLDQAYCSRRLCFNLQTAAFTFDVGATQAVGCACGEFITASFF